MAIELSPAYLKIGLSCVVVLSLLLVRLPGMRRFEALVFGLTGVVGFAAYFNFGIQYQQWNSGFLSRWELYHYQLGSKYFPELGFDGLYSASLLAQQQSLPGSPVWPLRDLETFEIISVGEHAPKLREVRGRFSEERWRSFVADHDNYIRNTLGAFWKYVRMDHGYNPTPTWTFVARLFDARLGSSNAELAFLASLDILLMAGMFTIVFRTYGYKIGCLALAIAALGFGWRFQLLGALLRWDWIAAVVIGICMLERGRFATAGACIGYAAMVRVFPALFLVGPTLLAVKSWLAGERPRWPIRLAAGFGMAVCVGLIGGSMTGHGVDAWKEFAEHIQVYRNTWFRNNVGMDSLFAHGPSLMFRADPVDVRSSEEILNVLHEHRVERIVASGIMLTLLALAVWRASLVESVLLSVAAIFALTPVLSYYGMMAVVVPLRRGHWAPLAVLSFATVMHVLVKVYPSEFHRPWLYGLFAWGTALLLVAWLLPSAVCELKAMRLFAWRRMRVRLER